MSTVERASYTTFWRKSSDLTTLAARRTAARERKKRSNVYQQRVRIFNLFVTLTELIKRNIDNYSLTLVTLCVCLLYSRMPIVSNLHVIIVGL